MLTRFAPRLLAFLLILTTAACADGLVSDGDQGLFKDRHVTAESSGKFRHGHLLESASSVAGKNGKTKLILKLKPQKILDRYQILDRYKVLERYQLLERFEIVERYSYDYVFDGFAIETNTETLPELFSALAADPEIDTFEPDFSVSGRPFALGYQSEAGEGELLPWSLERIGAVQEDKISELQDVVLFVVDTGVDHDDVKLKLEHDFSTGLESDGVDPDGHGTHIAGIAAAEINGKGLSGIAPKTQVYSLKVLGNESDEAIESDDLDLSTAIAAVEYIARFKHENQHVPVVANLSFGADVGSEAYTALDDAIVAASAMGVTFVVSAGNDGADAATYTPAHVAEAITVGAYDPANRFASFSNFGGTVDILAPGVDIISLKAGEEKESRNYATMSGTSMAAAHVSGAVARFLALNQQAAPWQVADAITASGRDWVTGTPSGTTTTSVYVGSGHLDGAYGGAGLMQQHVGPFGSYALTAGNEIKFEGQTIIRSASSNASLLSNGKISLKDNGSIVEGFGYHAAGIDENLAIQVFVPKENTLGLPAHSEFKDQLPIDVPDAQSFEARATRQFGGMEMAGTYDLGEGGIWYINGNLKTVGPTTFTGTGILIVKGSLEIKHPFANSAGVIGIYVDNTIKTSKDAGLTRITGALFADTIKLEGSLEFTGQAVAGSTFEVKNEARLDMKYLRVPAELTRPLWGN